MDHLLLLDVERVALTAVVLRAVWAMTSGLIAGHRRLAELVPQLYPPAAAADPDPAPAAGDRQATT